MTIAKKTIESLSVEQYVSRAVSEDKHTVCITYCFEDGSYLTIKKHKGAGKYECLTWENKLNRGNSNG